MTEYSECKLCARACGVNRTAGEVGYCGMTDIPTCSRASLHMWEEPPISGERGSGTVFFSGCSLGCIYCQNEKISHGGVGKNIGVDGVVTAMLKLQAAGAHNVNFVTPTHFAPSVREAVKIARKNGFSLPIVYNTGAYDTTETIRSLADTVDIWLPDYKYADEKLSAELSAAPDYPEVAFAAISEMVKLCPAPVFDGDGIMRRGVIVRVLLLPGHVANAKLAVGKLHRAFGDKIYVSLMNQYTPMPGMKPPLDRTVTHEEYRDLCDYADRIGVRLGFTQEFGTAKESFIPPFDFTGI